MENEKNVDLEGGGVDEEDFVSDTSSRARNRTVMLTPEITGQVRARLNEEIQGGGPEPESRSGADDGFTPIGEFVSPGAGGPVASEPPVGDPAPSSGGPFIQTTDTPFSQSSDPLGTPAASFQAPQPVNRAPAQPAAVTPQPSAQAYSGGEGVIWVKESPVVGFLVSYDVNPNGTVYELRAGRLIVTSEPAGGGNYLVVLDKTVSPMHAIMRVSGDGDLQILDQLSEYGTKIYRAEDGSEEELSGDKSHLLHGDVVVFGERTFCVCIVVRPEEAEDE